MKNYPECKELIHGLIVFSVSPAKAVPPAPATTLTPPVTTSTPGPFPCNFETGLCGWSQDKTDSFDWTRINKASPSTGTGPSSDHTSGRKYMDIVFNTFLACGDFCRLLITLANSLDPDQS